MLWHFFGLNISPNFLFHFLFCWRRLESRAKKQYRRSGKAFLKTGLRGNPSSNQSFCCPLLTKKLLFTLITLLPLTCYLQCLKSKVFSSKYSVPKFKSECSLFYCWILQNLSTIQFQLMYMNPIFIQFRLSALYSLDKMSFSWPLIVLRISSFFQSSDFLLTVRKCIDLISKN